MFKYKTRKALITTAAFTALFALTSCAAGDGGNEGTEDPDDFEFGLSDDDYSLEALIEAAQAEDGELVVYDSTGKVVKVVEGFAEKYGVRATGAKMAAKDQIELIVRENQAQNVQSDVFHITDIPTISTELLAQDYVVSWFPSDLESVIDEQYRNPVQVSTSPVVWAYNTEVYGDTCPIDNMWELTDEKYKGKIAFYDAELKPSYLDWFNQISLRHEDKMLQAYKNLYGEDLKTDEESAIHEWVKRFLANGVRLSKSDSDMSEAVGAPGQSDPPFGMFSVAKFRDIESQGFHLGVCEGMDPWTGLAYGKGIVISKNTKNPNKAKLFVHYALTEDGLEPSVSDGKLPTNSSVSLPDDEPSGIEDFLDEIFILDSVDPEQDYENRSDFSDFWIQHR